MKKTLKILFLTGFMSLCMLLPATVAYSQNIINQDGLCTRNPEATLCKDNTDQDINSNSIFGPNGILTKAAQVVALITGVASIIMIISSGIQYAISSGDPARLNRAKDTLVYALIGLVIAMSAQAIIVFVLKEIG